MELSDLYSSKIIEFAANLPIIEPLEYPMAKAHKVSRVCGSSMQVEINMKNGKVSEYSHEISACALGQSAAFIVAKQIIGSTSEELYQLRNIMKLMIKESGEPPQGKFSELKYLQPVHDYPARHTSTLLIFEVVVDCLDKIEQVKNV